MKRILLFNILFCAFVGVGFAQTITVRPDVICEGENSYIGTDTNLNYVHIGDILCFQGTDTANYIIVRPEAWSMYEDDYTPLSVVFYVDQTGKHGWAVGLPDIEVYGGYMTVLWSNIVDEETGDYFYFDLQCIQNYSMDNRQALSDINGSGNTLCIRDDYQYCDYVDPEDPYWPDGCNYPAAAYIAPPFYLPALGQLNSLFAYQYIINEIIVRIVSADPYMVGTDWWSSTEENARNVFSLHLDGTIGREDKSGFYGLILPVMDF